MKYHKILKALLILQLIFILCALVALQSCDSGPEGPDNTDALLLKLHGTWTTTNGMVLANGVNVTDAFAGLAITFNEDKSYTVVNSVSPIWPQNGFYTVDAGSSTPFDIRRDNDTMVNVILLTAHELQFTMSYTAPGGRVKGISGNYEFTLTR
jgi:hypothetical protein